MNTSDSFQVSSEPSEKTVFPSHKSPSTHEPAFLCGGNLTAPNGVIQSPNVATSVMTQVQNVHCLWNIEVQHGWVVDLVFTHFDLDSVSFENGCDERYAHVKVIYGGEWLF